MKMKGGICVLVGSLLVVFSLTMVAEGQRKNRIRGNQGRRSVGKPGNTIQQKRKGQPSFRDIMDGTSNTLRRDQRGVELYESLPGVAEEFNDVQGGEE